MRTLYYLYHFSVNIKIKDLLKHKNRKDLK